MGVIRNIPKKYRSGFVELNAISDQSIDELQNILKTAPPVLGPKALAEAVKANIKTLDFDTLYQIINSVSSLSEICDSKKSSIDELVLDVVEIVKEEKIIDDKLFDDAKFKERLSKLLSIEALLYPLKSVSLLTEHENVLLTAKIISDIRPIFGFDILQKPKAAVIIHLLHLHYLHGMDGAEHNDFVVALDEDDLKRLKDVIERAEAKSKSLKSFISDTNLTYLS